MSGTPSRIPALPGLAERSLASLTRADLLVALVNGWCLAAVVPIVLDAVERDPLCSAGRFPGDLLRGLMEIPGGFWGQHPRMYDRYRNALRAGAALRRQLPAADRMRFWEPLDGDPAGEPAPARR